MATTEEVARDLLASVNTDAGFLNAIKWVDYRYKQLCSRVRFRHLREIGEVQIPAYVSTGVVATTRNATGVVGTSTTWATAPTTTTVATNWYFRDQSAWYQVASWTDDTNFTLTTAYSEDGGSSRSYNLVQRYHSLNTNARWLGDFVHTRLRTKIDVVNLGEMDREAPGRVQSGSFPMMVSQLGTDSSGDLQVEFYPYSRKSEIVHYVYWSKPTTLGISTIIPPQIDPQVLIKGAKCDLYEYLMSKAALAGNIDAAALFRNEKNTLETRWERVIQEAKRADRGIDDTTFILKHFGDEYGRGVRDITDARDEVYIRGDRSW
jgi:hypothetical protein